MTTNTSKIILEYIAQRTQASPKDLYNLLNISPRAVFSQLKRLCDKNLIRKIGQPPKVYYQITNPSIQGTVPFIPKDTASLINTHFYYVSALGEEKIGLAGFEAWCNKQGLDTAKTAEEYALTIKKYAAFRKHGLIDGMHKLRTTFKQPALDKMFYIDFYAIERFGKTKLGQILLLAKSSQDKKQINSLIETVSPCIHALIKQFNIDGVGFIPPTVKRQVQLMHELKKRIHLKTHLLSIIKAKTSITIAQKTLNKLQDRVDNARQTIIIEDKNPFNNILLIDDAVGSGATINETAAQIQQKKLCSGKIIGLAIVGSFKGFDVISEV